MFFINLKESDKKDTTLAKRFTFKNITI